MRTLTKTGIRILSAKYRSILIKCAIINASVFIGMLGTGSAFAVASTPWDDLESAIENTEDNPIIIENNIEYSEGSEDITVNRTVTINGQNHILSGGSAYQGLTIGTDGDLTISNITMKNFKIQDGLGAAINNQSGKLDVAGTFTANNAKLGGAIYNNSTINNINANFNTNVAGYNTENNEALNLSGNGGAIYNYDGTIANIEGNFNRNSAFNKTKTSEDGGLGGAIYNHNQIDNINANFTGNVAGYVDHTTKTNVYSEIYNAIQMYNGKGGAIYNEGEISALTGNFSGNHATYGGAIYNKGAMNIYADDKNIKFNGNYVPENDGTDGGLGGAIYNDVDGTMGLYATSEKSITFTGTLSIGTFGAQDVDGIYNLGTLNINDGTTYTGTMNFQNIAGTGTTNIYGGTVNALADIAQSATNVNNATLKLGIVGTGEDARAVNVSNLNLTNNAKLDAYNGHIDTTAIKSITGTNTVKFDVDLANKTGDYNNSDTFNITTFVDGSKLDFNVGDVNFISDMVDSAYGKIKLADKKIGTIEKIVNSNVADSKYKYLFKASNSDGSIDILRALKVGLREYVHNNVSDEFPAYRTYTMNEYEYIIETLGGFGTGATSLTVDGTSNHYGIIGNGFGGITVGNEKTLTITDVGELNPDGSIKSSINGFMKSGGYGGFIIAQNGGIVNIENSVISSNTVSGNNAYGGAIFNMGNATLNVTDSAFIDNQAVKDDSNGSGGAIYNYTNGITNILAENKKVVFRGNISGDGTSGAIYNAGTLGLYAKENKEITFEGKKDGVASSTADTIFNSGTMNINGNFESNDYTGEVNLVGVTGENGTTNIYGGTVFVNDTFEQNKFRLSGSSQATMMNNIDISESLELDENSQMIVNGKLTTNNVALSGGSSLKVEDISHTNEITVSGASSLILGSSVSAVGTLVLDDGSTLNLQNNSIGIFSIDTSFDLYGTNYLMIDADLENTSMDQIKNTGGAQMGTLIVSDIKLLSDATQDKINISLFADGATRDVLKNNVRSNIKGLTYSSIYKYDALYDPDTGMIGFTRYNSGTSDDFNPYIYAPSVVANTTAAMTTQIATLAMDKMDDVVHTQGRSGGDTPSSSNVWVRVMGLNDNVEFNNFENIDSKALTVAAGYNTNKITCGDCGIVFGAYAGYIGGKQQYTANDIDQNGGYVGLSSALTLGDAFLTATVNGGLLNNKANNMYGNDRFNTLWFGTGLKAGYNYAITDSVVLQPNVYGGYTLVNTQDYTSVSGVKIATNNLNFFEVDPGLKLSAVIADGWTGSVQGKYAIVMDNGANITANDIALQNISTKNYIEYGIGIDKSVTDAFYLGAKVNRHDGGRTGWNGSIEFRYKF